MTTIVVIDAFATIIGVMVIMALVIGMPVMMIYVITCMMTLALDGAVRASS